jgi:hypothetical protein
MTKIVTRLFDSIFDAQHAVIELERIGVPHGDVSLISHKSDDEHAHIQTREPKDQTAGEAAGSDASFGAAAGGVLGAAGGVLVGLGVLAIPGVGPVVAAGWLATAAVGAVVGGAVVGAAGGLVGALTNSGVSEEEAHVYAESVRRGGSLVSAKVADDKLIAVETALANLPIVDLAARRRSYQEAGYEGFEARTEPYAPGASEPYAETETLRDRELESRV